MSTGAPEVAGVFAGANLDAISTPSIILDGAGVMRNIEAMSAYVDLHELNLRPHTKTHKSIVLASRQIEAGAIGLTAAKVGEIVEIAHASDDLLLAYPIVDYSRAVEVAEIARHKTVRVAIDSARAVDLLCQAAQCAGVTVGMLVDIDVGHRRTGVQSAQASLNLAIAIASSPGLHLDGIFFFPGHVNSPPSQQAEELVQISDQLQQSIDLWNRNGLRAEIVSGGSTPTAYQSHLIPQLTEIRPGTYIFNDMNTVHGGFCTLDQCSARVLATVVSSSVPGQVVIDAGSKTLTDERCVAAPDSGYGYVVEYPAARIAKLNEEHGMLDVRRCDEVPELGERITIVPNHICPCINLQDRLWWVESGKVPQSLKVDTRGKVC